MEKRNIYIIARSYFMTDFILDEFSKDSHIIIVPFIDRKNWITAFLKWFRLLVGNKKGLFKSLLFHDGFLKAINQITPNDHVLLWSIENLKNTLLITREIDSSNVVTFLWNPMKRLHSDTMLATKYMRQMNENGIQVITFDPYDSKLLGCRLVPQVHRSIQILKNASPNGVFFVGQLKGRENILETLAKEFSENNIAYHFHIVCGSHEKELVPCVLKQYVSQQVMTYNKTLECINSAECLLDIVQQGQDGLTLRPIEALFYRKKLITNNPSIKKEAFYHPNNIYIIGDPDEKRTILSFLHETQYQTISAEIEQIHHIRTWLKSLMA